MKESLLELAARDVAVWRPKISLQSAEGKEALEEWIEEMKPLISQLELGRVYVYFDGHAVPADSAGLTMKGICRSHDLDYVPQVRAMTDASAKALLEDIDYWTTEDEP